MDNNIAVIYDYPAVAGEALLLSSFFMFGADVFYGGFGERINHAVTGAGANDEIVGKRDDFFQIYQDYILPFFIFKGIDNFVCEFQCVQFSPLYLLSKRSQLSSDV